MTPGVRIGVDVGGTFTKAVALTAEPFEVAARAVVPTTHGAREGVAAGVAQALREIFGALGARRADVELVAFSTTQAMNALLEGDVARVGVVGIGAAPELRLARKRTHVGDIKLAPRRVLHTEHEFIDATAGLDAAAVDAALARIQAAGCEALAVSGAFAVDAPEHERVVACRARERGLPVCAGHELTGAYGLETRTVSAALNASILPVVERTARIVETVLAETGVDVPLLVLRGDGGAMSVDAFRGAPSHTIGSGPAAGVAAALHQLGLEEGIVLECGGTSSNVSVVKSGRTQLRTLRVMGRPTSIRSVDSWVIGAAGGSMARLGRRRVDEVGPRSAHIAGLAYACYAEEATLEGAEVELVAPRPGDPEQYAVLTAPDGNRHAITATCAAQALDGSSPAAALAFELLGRRLRRSAEDAAREVLDRTTDKIAQAVKEAAKAHNLRPDAPVVALGGAGGALAPRVAERLGRPCRQPRDAEVLSSIGAALSLVRAERARHGCGPVETMALAREAERACVKAGAAPQTVRVETSYEPGGSLLRAVATGAVALESGAAERPRVDEARQLEMAASALGIKTERLTLLASNDFYGVFSENGSGGVAVIDGHGTVALAENARRVIAADGADLLGQLGTALDEGTVNLGVGDLLPRVAVLCGPHLVDLSESKRREEVLDGAQTVIDDRDETAVAVIWQ